jgi:hypothetical protein
MSETKELHVFTADNEEWVVAASPEDAAEVYREYVGEYLGSAGAEAATGLRWQALPDEKPLTMTDEDAGVETVMFCGGWSIGGRRYLGSANT